MKTIILTCIIIFNFLIASAQSVANLDAKNGFKHYKFGSSIKNYPNLKVDRFLHDLNVKANTNNPLNHSYVDTKKMEDDFKKQPIKTYVDKKGNDYVGDLEVNDIKYIFNKGLLYKVEINIPYETRNDFFQSLSSLYGKPTKSGRLKINPNVSYHNWTGKKLGVSMDIDQLGKSCSIYYTSFEVESINNTLEKKQKELAKKKEILDKKSVIKDL